MLAFSSVVALDEAFVFFFAPALAALAGAEDCGGSLFPLDLGTHCWPFAVCTGCLAALARAGVAAGLVRAGVCVAAALADALLDAPFALVALPLPPPALFGCQTSLDPCPALATPGVAFVTDLALLLLVFVVAGAFVLALAVAAAADPVPALALVDAERFAAALRCCVLALLWAAGAAADA